MGDLGDIMGADRLFNQRLIADIALNELHLGGNRPPEPGRQIVEHDNLLAAIEQFEHHVAADVTRPTRDQHRHVRPRTVLRPEKERLDR